MNRFIPTAAFELRHAAPERTLWTLADTHFRTVPAWGFGDATAAVRPDQSVIAAPASESTRIESSETRSSNTSRNLDELDLLRTPVVRLFSVRAVWLVLLTLFGMLTSTAAGGVIGALLPFVAKRCGLDPATLSSPLITSVMDLLGVFIYFGLAYLFLADVLFG